MARTFLSSLQIQPFQDYPSKHEPYGFKLSLGSVVSVRELLLTLLKSVTPSKGDSHLNCSLYCAITSLHFLDCAP